MNIYRSSKIVRNTNETQVFVELNLDGTGKSNINTSIPFLDHMLNQIVCHSFINLNIKALGDLHIDFHHTIEDIGIVLGKAILKAIGNKKNIYRYGYSYIPLDEAMSRVIIDFSGRPYLKYNVIFIKPILNSFDLDLIKEFFIGLVNNSNITLHIDNLRGVNSHHKCETIFKAFGKALRMAINYNNNLQEYIPSTKGIL